MVGFSLAAILLFPNEIAVLAHFDDNVDEETKLKIVTNLQRENFLTYEKRHIPSWEELCGIVSLIH